MPNAIAFTLNLGPNVERRAPVDPDWLWRRLARYLRRATGRIVPTVMPLAQRTVGCTFTVLLLRSALMSWSASGRL